MVRPIEFKLDDFIQNHESQEYMSLHMEDLHGSVLIDNLILLQFLEQVDVQEVMAQTYHVSFTWLNMDPTPPDLLPIAEKYQVLLQRETDYIIVYIPLGLELDDAALQIDIPNYKLRAVFIADCNYKIVKYNLSTAVLSYQLADFRPLLVFRRVVMECKDIGATDIHFASVYVDKQPAHRIQFRLENRLVFSKFTFDFQMQKRILKSAIQKLSSASASDLDVSSGVTTDIPDVFGDGTTDLRLCGQPVKAGYNVTIRVQDIRTTAMCIDELGFPRADVESLRTIAQNRTGLTLVTGVMRSGKNTTIFAMVNELNTGELSIIEYSNPVEVSMSYPQIDYHGDIDLLREHLRMAKKQDVDIAIINEIPNKEVAFAARDLVNSAVGVITTTHVDRLWHVPNKLHEFYGDDYKTIVSQLNAIINHKMFRRWRGPGFQKRILQQGPGPFEKACYKAGVRQYFVPTNAAKVKYSVQPLIEIIILTDEEKTAMLNFDEIWRAEQMLKMHIESVHGTLENKLAQYVNEGICSLDEFRVLFAGKDVSEPPQLT